MIAARTPLRVRYLATQRPHFGAYAGFPRIAAYGASGGFSAQVREVANGDEDFTSILPFIPTVVRDWIRHRVQRRQQYWYKLSDLVAEVATAPAYLARHFELLHVLDGEHSAQYLPLLRRRFAVGVPVVATYHQPPRILDQILARDAVLALDHITVMSETQRDWFSQFVPRERVSVVLHGVDTAFFTPAARPRANQPVHLLTTGSWQRDWTVLASVASQLIGENIVLDVVSSSAPACAGQPNIQVHRDVSDTVLRDLYRRAHLMVLPLRDATANNALLEAMATGLPVIASDLPSLREYAPPPIVQFVEHHADAFVAAIRSLLSDADARGRMATDGIQRAAELSWPNVAARFGTLYRQVGGRP